MPNIVINNYCNQKCGYCFAEENMNISKRKDMGIVTFLKILKYLKINNEKEARILGGEPLLSKNIRNFILLSIKGGFNSIIFSNINIQNEKIKNIFDGLNTKNIRINCNINSKEFYKKEELENIEKNFEYFNKIGIKLIIGFNIFNLEQDANFVFNLAKKHDIKAINLKITNSSIGESLIIDNADRKLGAYIFKLIKKYHDNFFIEFGCGLDKNIFKGEELDFINKRTNIKLKFGCEGNIGKFDINTNGKTFKCFPLQNLYQKNRYDLNYIISNNIKIEENINYLNNNFGETISIGECIGNKVIKNIL